MTPGNPDVRVCPQCRKLVAQATLNSGNTFGATYWLDNKCEAPMLPDYPDLGRCPHCGVLMRQSTSAEVKQSGYNLPANADWLQSPSEADWLESLHSGMWDGEEEEIEARLLAWHAANDPMRHSEGEPQFSEAALHNLRALDALMATNDEPYFLVLRAEIARETGDFDAALQLLNGADAKFDALTTQIAALARAQNTCVKRRTF